MPCNIEAQKVQGLVLQTQQLPGRMMITVLPPRPGPDHQARLGLAQ